MPEPAIAPPASNKPIWCFLLCWTLLNAIQAYTLELHGDEAYYWMYSRFLDWGYFDHPPMVAIFIKIGDSLMHNELGLRLLTVITNSASLYIIWLMLKKYAVESRWFILVASGMFIFHVYGFTTTPDSPLLFFTVLFYFVYQQYINNDKWHLAFILSIIIACLLYSKYHGILVVGLTLCSNFKLLKRKSFWLIVILAAILFTPHVLWQVQHDYPSLKYHLVDRSAGSYNVSFTLLYPLGQLAMAGPFIGWFLFYAAFKTKINGGFIRALVFNCIGTFLFFLVNTFKGEVQPHWTLIAFVPLLMLVLISFKKSAPPKWLFKLTVANTVFILFIRAALLFQFPFVMDIGQFKSYFGFREWAAHLKHRVGDNYLIIRDGFQDPSKYNYYTNSLKAISYDSRFYRKTQYDMWPIEDSMQRKRAYFMVDNKDAFTTDSVVEKYGRKWYSAWVNDVRTYQKVGIELLGYQKTQNIRATQVSIWNAKDLPIKKITLQAGQAVQMCLNITNPNNYINFSLEGQTHPVLLNASLLQNGNQVLEENAGADFNHVTISAHHQHLYIFNFIAPAKKGNYDLLFSLRTPPFPGSKNSSTVTLIVQ